MILLRMPAFAFPSAFRWRVCVKMGYLLSEKSITRVQSFLDDMLASDRSLEWNIALEQGDPSKIAYYIRQAIRSAGRLGKAEIATLGNKFVIRVTARSVIAELRGGLSPTIIPQKLTLRELTKIEEVVGAVAKHPTRLELEFPDASLSLEELSTLKKWLSEKQMDFRFDDLNHLHVFRKIG